MSVSTDKISSSFVPADYPLKELEDSKVALDIALWVILYLGDVTALSHLETMIATCGVFVFRYVVQSGIDLSEEAKTTSQKVERVAFALECLGGAFLSTLLGTEVLSSDSDLWIFFATQLGLQCLSQGAKRLSCEESYDSTKGLEDVKFLLENAVLWLMMYLGDVESIDPLAMGLATVAILGVRLAIEQTLQKRKNEKINSVAKLIPYLEFFAGVLLSVLMMTGELSADDYLWLFFSMQLALMLVAQIAKRTIGEPHERYLCMKGGEHDTRIVTAEAK